MRGAGGKGGVNNILGRQRGLVLKHKLNTAVLQLCHSSLQVKTPDRMEVTTTH